MDRWTLRLGCLFAVAALIAGCGNTAVTLSSTTHAPTDAHAGTAHHAARAHRRAPHHPASRARFPASDAAAFRNNCAQSVRQQATNVAPQYRALTSVSIGIYCTCALHRVEASVGVEQFKHDIVSILVDHTPPPQYMLSAEGVCGAKLLTTLQQLTQQH